MNDDNVYPLGDDEITLIAEIQREGAVLQGRIIGVLNSFQKRHKLSGTWQIAENNREIRRIDVPVRQE